LYVLSQSVRSAQASAFVPRLRAAVRLLASGTRLRGPSRALRDSSRPTDSSCDVWMLELRQQIPLLRDARCRVQRWPRSPGLFPRAGDERLNPRRLAVPGRAGTQRIPKDQRVALSRAALRGRAHPGTISMFAKRPLSIEFVVELTEPRAPTGFARVLSNKATEATITRGTTQDEDFHQTVRSKTSKGEASPKLNGPARAASVSGASFFTTTTAAPAISPGTRRSA
jgi:hypothetical protein